MPSSISARADKKDSHPPVWCVYIIENRLGQLYTGITTNLLRRLRQHRGEIGGGARALRGKSPLTIRAVFRTDGKSEAARLEWRIKSLSRAQKTALFNHGHTESDSHGVGLFALLNGEVE